jgi:polyhydroxyalkanoate synthesis repressor PhaR
MAKDKEPTIIKKYANRRLYNTGTSTYVTLEDLAEMVKGGEDFLVNDAKTGEDITRSVLTQIIFEQEGKGQNLLPITFLRQLIRFYGDQMQAIVPSYLEQSLAALTREQDKFRATLAETFGGGSFGLMDEQIRRNTEIFERAFRMFMPFGAGSEPSAGVGPAPDPAAARGKGSDLDAMREQLDAMQKKIDALAAKSERSDG